MTKIRNKVTGEIIDLQTSKPVVSDAGKERSEGLLKKFNRLSKESEERITERGTIQKQVRTQFEKPELMGKLAATLTVIGAPFSAIESAIANPVLLAQQGNLSPLALAKESLVGLALQKQGQFGDVFKNIAIQKDVADVMGLTVSLAGATFLLKKLTGAFGTVAKMSDKGILKAGKFLINAADKAKKVVGVRIGKAFSTVDDIPANGIQFLDDVIRLPKSVLKRAEEIFGNLDDFADKLTVGKLREFKRFLGKLKPGAFGKGERGISETIDVIDLNKGFAKVKNLMKKTLEKSQGKKITDNLMDLEANFSDVIRAGNTIRKAVIDPTLRKATKAGKVAAGLGKEGDVTTRTALNILRKASAESKKAVDKSIILLNRFNRQRQLAEFGKRAIGAAAFGGVAGAVGGRALRGIGGEGQE